MGRTREGGKKVSGRNREMLQMAVTVDCSGCGTRLKVADPMEGKSVRCPRCKGIFKVPENNNPVDLSTEIEPSASPEPEVNSEILQKARPRKNKKPVESLREGGTLPLPKTTIITRITSVAIVVSTVLFLCAAFSPKLSPAAKTFGGFFCVAASIALVGFGILVVLLIWQENFQRPLDIAEEAKKLRLKFKKKGDSNVLSILRTLSTVGNTSGSSSLNYCEGTLDGYQVKILDGRFRFGYGNHSRWTKSTFVVLCDAARDYPDLAATRRLLRFRIPGFGIKLDKDTAFSHRF